MPTDPLEDAMLSARKLLVDLGRHLDNAEVARDLGELGRAWVRAAQLERVLRGALPPDATAEARGAVEAAAPHAHDADRTGADGAGGA